MCSSDLLFRRWTAARLWILAGSLLVSSPFLRLIAHAQSLDEMRLAACCLGFSNGFFMGNIFPAAFEVAPKSAQASAVGFLNLFGAIISGLATYFGGLWRKSLGIDGLLANTSIAYAVCGVLLAAGISIWFQQIGRAHV